MAKQQQSKKRAQGGGRTPNSEPRQQVFSQFSGCNFQLSPLGFESDYYYNEESHQSDLMMNYVAIQNNAAIVDNRTIETRNNIVSLFKAPSGKHFTRANFLVDGMAFFGLDDGSLVRGLPQADNMLYEVSLDDETDTGHHWTSFAYIDDQLVGMTSENRIWSGAITTSITAAMSMETSKYIDNPRLGDIDIRPQGNLTISELGPTEAEQFRIAVAICYVGKYGPTACSPQYSFYANAPVDEWNSRQYLVVGGEAPTGVGIKAVEVFYNVGNAQSLQFAGRYDFASGDGGEWRFDWLGYLDETAMWPIANLVAPTENYSLGVHASHVTCIDGRLYFWGDKSRPERLWIGGNPGNIFSTSPGTGGGYVDVEPGTGQEIRVVTKYKTQSGNSIVTMLCDSKNSSREQRYNLVENTITISNEQSMKAWQAEQVAGAVGCKSYRGGLVCEDGLYSVSRYGLALTTMTMEYNSQIRANYVSGPIKPAFTNPLGTALKNSILLECDGVIYLAFGNIDDTIDNLLFCYDIDLKSWWTTTIDTSEPIIDLFHIDYEGQREGIGIVTQNAVYMLPLTIDDDTAIDMTSEDDPGKPTFETTIQTGELATTQPQQNWIYLSQLEFRFDYFVGDVTVELTAIDQFGRKIETRKKISHDQTQYNLAEYMRVDLRVQSYNIRIRGEAKFRLTHFIAKLYTMSSKQGLVWGFDDRQTFRSNGDIHPTFKSYNDIRKAIIA